ncbi:hypothetical protein ElyMa_002442900 [Elysia marginata]|uniref:Uncharacterized protein n=1 Tax=Elysia marginata TaxID=1093978 RepID=A0AAV4GJL6_9GAST|nr:hypothetical protein ElyMa_002442900 [Elysia marginata]
MAEIERILSDKIFTQAAAFVPRKHNHQYHLDVNHDDMSDDMSVSFDSLWLTREHKSLIGIDCVIDVLTGLIIDGLVCSLHCHTHEPKVENLSGRDTATVPTLEGRAYCKR